MGRFLVGAVIVGLTIKYATVILALAASFGLLLGGYALIGMVLWPILRRVGRVLGRELTTRTVVIALSAVLALLFILAGGAWLPVFAIFLGVLFVAVTGTAFYTLVWLVVAVVERIDRVFASSTHEC